MNKQSGFSILLLLLLIVVLGAIGFAGFKVANQNKGSTQQIEQSASVSQPECTKKPVLTLPVESARIQSVLYPGQVRGNNFKPHGGFRLNGSNEASITLPQSAKVVSGVRYYEGGELQYMFDFEADCGYRFRLDHLHTLSPAMQQFAEQLPAPTEDSRTTNINSEVLNTGAVVATKVGFVQSNNASFDFGFYNMNEKNEASKRSDWPQDFEHQNELATHATCWFDYFSASDAEFLRGLPAADQAQGKSSVYCD